MTLMAATHPLPMPPGLATAVWVGQLDVRRPIGPVEVSRTFASALLLVTVDGVPVGQVGIPLVDGHACAGTVRTAVLDAVGDKLDRTPPPLAPVRYAVTVVIATRNRPENVARCVRSLLRSTHQRFTVLVVDNDPDNDRTETVVRDLDDARVEYLREAQRGTSAGRNRGLVEAVARGARFVAFTDDDVEVDQDWVGRMASALAEPDVACVCGPVMAARLDTPAQQAADAALGRRKGFARRRFSLAEPPAESAVFPFSPGLFGVGANMAVNVAVATEIGGFDPALGPGTPARAGEDCEFMVRLVLAGHTLAYEPSAYVWHHHRGTGAALGDQLDGYAVGLGSYLTKIMLDPAGRAAALRRVPAAIAQLRSIGERSSSPETAGSAGGRRLRTLVSGPPAYLAARRAVRRAGGNIPPLVAGNGSCVDTAASARLRS
jgi:GT2 family glycosyltransferase